jgi:hypothetical protein
MAMDATTGFVRVRKRRLKGGNYRDVYYTKRAYAGGPTASTSYDLVRAERVNGKPRHRFVLGLGSLKEPRKWDHDLEWFWANAFHNLKTYGLDERQCRHITDEMVRKGDRHRAPRNAPCLRVKADFRMRISTTSCCGSNPLAGSSTREALL